MIYLRANKGSEASLSGDNDFINSRDLFEKFAKGSFRNFSRILFRILSVLFAVVFIAAFETLLAVYLKNLPEIASGFHTDHELLHEFLQI